MASDRARRSNLLMASASRLVLAAVLSGALSLAPLAAAAAPKDGVVVVGDGGISQSSGLTVVNQNSRRVVIDWRSFDIDPSEVVRFVQPGSDAIALNRVLDRLPTNIRGALEANGHVWLVNQTAR